VVPSPRARTAGKLGLPACNLFSDSSMEMSKCERKEKEEDDLDDNDEEAEPTKTILFSELVLNDDVYCCVQ
jgi:hypothetical protein